MISMINTLLYEYHHARPTHFSSLHRLPITLSNGTTKQALSFNSSREAAQNDAELLFATPSGPSPFDLATDQLILSIPTLKITVSDPKFIFPTNTFTIHKNLVRISIAHPSIVAVLGLLCSYFNDAMRQLERQMRDCSTPIGRQLYTTFITNHLFFNFEYLQWIGTRYTAMVNAYQELIPHLFERFHLFRAPTQSDATAHTVPLLTPAFSYPVGKCYEIRTVIDYIQSILVKSHAKHVELDKFTTAHVSIRAALTDDQNNISLIYFSVPARWSVQQLLHAMFKATHVYPEVSLLHYSKFPGAISNLEPHVLFRTLTQFRDIFGFVNLAMSAPSRALPPLAPHQ